MKLHLPHHMLQKSFTCIACLNQMTNRASTPITANHVMPIHTECLVWPPCLIWRSWSCLPCLFSSGSPIKGIRVSGARHQREAAITDRSQTIWGRKWLPLTNFRYSSPSGTWRARPCTLFLISECYGIEPCHGSSAAKCKVASDGFRLRSMGRRIIWDWWWCFGPWRSIGSVIWILHAHASLWFCG